MRKKLIDNPKPVYLGVTLDCTISYKYHVIKTKTKAWNNILRKLSNSKWGTDLGTIQRTAFVMCYSAAECVCPVWGLSTHAKKMDPVINMTCRDITDCVKPARVDDLYLVYFIAPPSTRTASFSQRKRTKQERNYRHPLFQHEPTPKRFKSKSSFLHSLRPLDSKPYCCMIDDWSTHMPSIPHKVYRDPVEFLPNGAN